MLLVIFLQMSDNIQEIINVLDNDSVPIEFC